MLYILIFGYICIADCGRFDHLVHFFTRNTFCPQYCIYFTENSRNGHISKSGLKPDIAVDFLSLVSYKT